MRTLPADRPSICFVAHNALGALLKEDTGHVGGIERQQALMATWLATRGWNVSIVTWPDKVLDEPVINGVRVHALCDREAGVPGIRFVFPRWRSLNQALRAANSHIYYYNCGDLGLGQIAIWIRRSKRKLVFSVPSDPDCDRDLPSLKHFRERALYRYGLKSCDSIIVQSERQRTQLAANFGKQSSILPMPCAGFQAVDTINTHGRGSSLPRRFRVLWVGRVSIEKRVEWVLEIAESLPDVEFVLVGAPNQSSVYEKDIADRAFRLTNVRMLGRLPYDALREHYCTADLLCSTSIYEGFPNVYIEAWSVGVPVLTTNDPDGVIERNNLGRYCATPKDFVSTIDELRRDKKRLTIMSSSAQEYFDRYHQIDTAMERFDQYFRMVLEKQ